MLSVMRNVFLSLLLLLCALSFYGQALVRYGNQSISRDEFLTAFRKNNAHTKATEKAYRDYLNLYTLYRLKLQAALDMKLDTMAGQAAELQNFRNQIADQYINDEISLNQMAKEAFVRSQHDLRISYIFVAAPKNASPEDTAKAWQKIQDAYKALKNNKGFGETALQFSEDPSVKNNKGDIGYITVFDLPYLIETVAYKTPLGKYSPVFRTGGGYIILKKTAERAAAGHIRIAQILVPMDFDADEGGRIAIREKVDSIYGAVKGGADFDMLAMKYNIDDINYQSGGILPEFGTGKNGPAIEMTTSIIKKDGDLCEYYENFFGFHIVKRIPKKPVSTVGDKKTLDEFKEMVKTDPRVALSRKQILQTIIKQTGFREYIPAGNDQSTLFQFSDKKYLIGDWIAYRESLNSDLTKGKTNTEIFNSYRQSIAFEYYKEHLEKYNPAFALRLKEFRDGNLLFEVMQIQVWNKAGTDTAGLKARGQAISDYQTELENQWIEELKKKYPVTVSETVFKTLPR